MEREASKAEAEKDWLEKVTERDWLEKVEKEDGHRRLFGRR